MKLLKKFVDSKKILFIMTLIFGISISFLFLNPTYNFDGFCQLSHGYFSYSRYFFGGGRPLTGLVWVILSILKIPNDILSILAHLLSLIFQSISVVLIFDELVKYTDKSSFEKWFCYLGSLLIIFNPFVMDFYIYEESFCMFLSLMFSILAAKYIIKEKYFLSTLFLVCNVFLYQGTLSAFFPLVLLFLFLQNKDKDFLTFIKSNFKKIFWAGIIYCVALIVGFLSIKMYVLISGNLSKKVGYIDIIENIKIIFNLLYISIKYLQGMFDSLMFKLLFCSLILIVVLFSTLDLKNNFKKLFYLLILISVSLLICFVPNLVMSTNENYTAARMLCSMGMIFGIVFISALLFCSDNNKKERRLLLFLVFSIGFIFMIINCNNYITNSKLDYQRYQLDIEEIDEIDKKIEEYEKDNDIEISKIYFYTSNLGGTFYNSSYTSYYLSRVKNNYWAFECLSDYYLDINGAYSVDLSYIEEKLDIEIKESEIEEDIYYFDKDILYLILY